MLCLRLHFCQEQWVGILKDLMPFLYLEEKHPIDTSFSCTMYDCTLNRQTAVALCGWFPATGQKGHDVQLIATRMERCVV